LDFLSAGQRYFSDYTQLQLLPFFSRVTGEFEGLDIGTVVVLLPFHHPVDIAERVAILDALHDGTTALDVGAGYRDIEFEVFEVPKSEHVSLLIEAVGPSKRLLSEDDVTYDGEYYTVGDATIPIQSADIDVRMAGNANTPSIALQADLMHG
jgi:alkanesulfonate monooxygenase SsuD/methylene tetrahydromethanopterin reductase-like flavin-dependent oxidoreductase (luciferase family)